jgi:protein-tyrosine sulfotransferase
MTSPAALESVADLTHPAVISLGPAAADGRGASADPVFVLCMGRTGSTLLRFLLDAHPELACPPETNVPALCGQLANVWALIEGAPLSANRGDEPPEIPNSVIVGVRETMDRMVGSYLQRRGKKRYCDKSLGTARYTYLMSRVWPEAKFICLFRHPMDVVASGIEACPWGLNGYGFDQYIAETPGNAVHAMARFWMDNAAAILSAQEQWPERCHQIRYEDMTCDPQATADELYEFLGVAKVPGIGRRIFAAERERSGPADYKIWHTSRISTDSIGRGWTVPAGMIAPQLRTMISEYCERLGYLPVDDYWGTADQPADLRVPTRPAAGAGTGEFQTPVAEGRGTPLIVAASETEAAEMAPLLIDRLRTGIKRTGPEFAARWEPCGQDSVLAVVTPETGHGPAAHWRVDVAAGTVTIEEPDLPGPPSEAPDANADAAEAEADTPAEKAKTAEESRDGREEEAAEENAWEIIASADTWQQVLTEKVNLSVALRRHMIRYCDQGDTGPVTANIRVAMLADLLGLTSWGRGSCGRRAVAAGTR